MSINKPTFFNKYDQFLKTIKVPILVNLNSTQNMLNLAEKVTKNVLDDSIICGYLKKLKEFDEYTHNHSINVAMLCFFLGFNRGYNLDELIVLVKGALLHDIGKTTIPLNILNKPGRLTPDEFSVIQTHSVAGYEILKDEPIDTGIKNIVLYHHARLDDSGYPIVKKGETLTENIQIASLCDVFDALTGDRVYKPGMSKVAAYRIIHSEMSGKLNTELLDCLIDNISLLDVGDVALLTTQEKCKVVALNTSDLNRPIVQIIEGENTGKTIDLTVDRSLDLIYT